MTSVNDPAVRDLVAGIGEPAPERLTAWRCIGCGRLEASKPCIGVCKDRKVELVDALAYDALRDELAELERFVRFIASVKPRPDAVGATLEEFRRRARESLGVAGLIAEGLGLEQLGITFSWFNAAKFPRNTNPLSYHGVIWWLAD